MKYLLLIRVDPSIASAPDEPHRPVEPWVAEMEGRGVRLEGHELAASATARTVRIRRGKLSVARFGAVEVRAFAGD